MDLTCPGFTPLSRNLGFPALGIPLGRFISLFFPPLQAAIPSLAPRHCLVFLFCLCLFIKDAVV